MCVSVLAGCACSAQSTRCLAEYSRLLRGHTRVDVLPMINPDGFELSLRYRAWRGNGNNADLNRNFGVGWGHGERASNDKASQNYQGQSPESEAETQIVIDLLEHGEYNADERLLWHQHQNRQ